MKLRLFGVVFLLVLMSAFAYTSNNYLDDTQFAGATWAERVNAAVTAVSATGGTVDARGECANGAITAADANVVLGTDTKPIKLLLGSCTYPLGAHSIQYFPGDEIGGTGPISGGASQITFTGSSTGMVYGGSLGASGVYHLYFHDFAIQGDGVSPGSLAIDWTSVLQSMMTRLNVGGADNGYKLGGTGTCACYNQITGVVASALVSSTSKAGWFASNANKNQIYGGLDWGKEAGLEFNTAFSDEVYGTDFEGSGILNAVIIDGASSDIAIYDLYNEMAGPILLKSGTVNNYIVGNGGLSGTGSVVDNSGNTTNYINLIGGGGATQGWTPYWLASRLGILFGPDYGNGANSWLRLESAAISANTGLTLKNIGTQSATYGHVGYAPFNAGFISSKSGYAGQGAHSISQLPTPAAPVISVFGTTGSTSYGPYFVVCHDRNGGVTLPSAASNVVTNGPATLTGSNHIIITEAVENGCDSWDVLKADTEHSITTNAFLPSNLIEPFVTVSFNDTGGSSSVYVAPGRNSTGDLALSAGAVTKLPCSTVANLPTSPGAGSQACVTDWNGTTGVCAGGGALYSPAVYTGAAWDCP